MYTSQGNCKTDAPNFETDNKTKKLDLSLYPSNAHIKMNTPWQPPPNSSLCTPNPPFKLPILFKNYHRFSRKETFLACWTYYSVYLKKAKKKSESSRNHCTHESVLNRTMQKQNCKTASQKPVCQLTDDKDRKKKNLSRPVLKHGPPHQCQISLIYARVTSYDWKLK